MSSVCVQGQKRTRFVAAAGSKRCNFLYLASCFDNLTNKAAQAFKVAAPSLSRCVAARTAAQVAMEEMQEAGIAQGLKAQRPDDGSESIITGMHEKSPEGYNISAGVGFS